MTLPLVSVLIPCHNAAAYVGETLESVRRQTWPNIEVIVVDDGSNDASAEVVERFGALNIRLIRQANAGVTVARQRALAESVGDFLQYLDADDLLSPDKIALQVARLAEAPDCVASAEWGRFVTDPAETRFEAEPVWRDLDAVDWLAASRADGLGMMFPALWLIPRRLADAAGPWDASLAGALGEDAEYFTRILLASRRVLFCAGARCFYRSAIQGSHSAQKSAGAWRGRYRVLELCERHVRAREDTERVRRGFALSWQHLAHACYPYDPPLAERAMERARAIHPVRVQPGGGVGFKVLSRLIGWRSARRLQVMSGRP